MSFNSIVLGISSSKKEIRENHHKHQLLPREKEKLCNPWNNVEIYFRNYQGEVKMTKYQSRYKNYIIISIKYLEENIWMSL